MLIFKYTFSSFININIFKLIVSKYILRRYSTCNNFNFRKGRSCYEKENLITPKEYSKLALLNGITSVIADPHEISNVLGINGINFMFDSLKNIPFDIYFMLSSCVPGTSFENSGATLLAED